jgi:hypothetical protein
VVDRKTTKTIMFFHRLAFGFANFVFHLFIPKGTKRRGKS